MYNVVMIDRSTGEKYCIAQRVSFTEAHARAKRYESDLYSSAVGVCDLPFKPPFEDTSSTVNSLMKLRPVSDMARMVAGGMR